MNSKVLVILERFGLEVGNRISTETWELLLKVVLGLTDLILKDPSDDMTHLSSRLCPLLLRVSSIQFTRNVFEKCHSDIPDNQMTQEFITNYPVVTLSFLLQILICLTEVHFTNCRTLE